MSTKDKFINDFQMVEGSILAGLAELEKDADLIVLVAVLSKIAAEAALDCGMSEEAYVHRMRSVYQLFEGKKLYKGD